MGWSHWTSQLRTVAGIAHGRRAFGGPLQLNLSLSNRCNIRCIHCYFYSPFLDLPNLRARRRARQNGAPPPPREDLEELQRLDADPVRTPAIMDEAFALGTRRVQFSGNGECFVHRNALDLMGRARRAGARCVANTNGTLIDRAAADELIRMGFDELRVTLMAGTPELYRVTHPGTRADLFDRVVGNLRYLQERKRALGADRPSLTAVCIVVDQNCDGLLDFARLSVDLGADRILFKPVDDVEDERLRPLIPAPERAKLAQQQVAQARAVIERAGVRHNIDAFHRSFGRQLDTAAVYRAMPCYYGWLACMVEPDGNVYACCRCDTPLGNAYETSFGEVWAGEPYRRFRHEAGRLDRGGRPGQGCECRHCVHHEANFRAFRILHPWRSRRLSNGIALPAPAR